VNERGLPRRERRSNTSGTEKVIIVLPARGDDDLFVSGIEGDPVSADACPMAPECAMLHHAFAAFRDLPEFEVVLLCAIRSRFGP